MIEFRAERPIWTDSLELYAKQQIDGVNYAWVCDGIKVIAVENRGLWPRFIDLTLHSDAAQSLFDALWRVGYRPHNGEASAAHVEAMKYHLDDMRKLVFK